MVLLHGAEGGGGAQHLYPGGGALGCGLANMCYTTVGSGGGGRDIKTGMGGGGWGGGAVTPLKHQ